VTAQVRNCFNSQQGLKMFHFFTASRPALGPTQLSFSLVPLALP